MTQPASLHVVSLSDIPVNNSCCNQAGERNFRRGYAFGYQVAMHNLAEFLDEEIRQQAESFSYRELQAWASEGRHGETLSRLKPPPTTHYKKTGKRRSPATAGIVYVVLAEGSTRIKIGWSTTPRQRIDALRTACPFPIRLLREIPSAQALDLERMLHTRYAAYRQHGEWFELPKDLLGEIILEDFTI